MCIKRNFRFITSIVTILIILFISSEVIIAASLSDPSITSLTAKTPTEVSVSWNEVKGSDNYEIYRSTSLSGSNYAKVGTTKKTSFVDKTVYPNITYRYSVKAVSGKNISNYAVGKTVTTPYKSYKDSDKAVFTNSVLENWVRKKLKKNKNETITIKDLNQFTEIGFAASTEIVDFSIHYNTDIGGVNTGNGTMRGFDFYDLKDFAQFRNLDTLYIIGQQVTDISPLANLKKLKSLNIALNHVYDINVLRNIPKLWNLNLESNPVKDIEVISSFKNLLSLNLNNTQITSIKTLESSNIGSLSLQGIKLKDLSPIKQMKLNDLIVSGNEYEDYSFLKNNETILFLRVSDLTDEKAKTLSSTKIEYLSLENMTDDFLTNLNMPSLKSLQLYHCDIKSLDFVKNGMSIEEFSASNAALDDITAFSLFKNLKIVNITGTNTRDISALKNLKKLVEVTLPTYTKESYSIIKNNVSWKPKFVDGSYTGEMYKYQSFKVSRNPAPKPSAITAAAPKYIDFGKTGTYNANIITDKLLNQKSTLPDASNQKIPYWKGTYIDCYKFSVNRQFDPGVMSEELFQFLSDHGMNYLRVLYSFSYLHDPGDTNKINISELERLDEIISWGIKYNVHVQFAMNGFPGKWNTSAEEEAVISTGGVNYINSIAEQKQVEKYWSMLGKRYANIPNKYLSFDLFAEPNIWHKEESIAIVKNLATSIWSAEGNKSDDLKRVLIIEYWMRNGDEWSEKLGEIGCAFSAGGVVPHRFAVGTGLAGFYEDYPYLTPTDTWPYFFEYRIGTGENQAVTINSELIMPKGTEIRIYLHKDNNQPVDFALQAEGEVILEQKNAVSYKKEKDNYYLVTLNESAKSIQFINRMDNDETISLYQITIHIPGKETIHLVPSSFANLPTEYSNFILTISKDLRISSNIRIDSDWYYNTQVKPFIEFAKAHNIGYIMHESGGGYAGDSIFDDFLKMQLKAFQEYKVPWTVECVNSFFLYYPRKGELKEYKNTSWFYTVELMKLIKEYASK